MFSLRGKWGETPSPRTDREKYAKCREIEEWRYTYAYIWRVSVCVHLSSSPNLAKSEALGRELHHAIVPQGGTIHLTGKK